MPTTSRKSPAQLIQEEEQKKDKVLAQLGAEYVAASSKIDQDYDESDKTALEMYRTTKAKAREQFDADIKAAEERLAQTNKEAEDAYRNAPQLAKETHAKGKKDVRDKYNQAKMEAESAYNAAVDAITAEE